MACKACGRVARYYCSDACALAANTDRGDGTGCYLWIGYRDDQGYGTIRLRRRNARAHRLALMLSGVAVANDALVCHRCDNPSCVRPDHLFVGTAADNAHDMVTKGRHARGVTHGSRVVPSKFSQLSPETIRAIREAVDSAPMRVLGERFGVAPSTIYRIGRGKAWADR